MKTTIWYEFTDKEDVQTLRDAADALEKSGYVKLLLPNVELDDTPIAGAGGCGNFARGSSLWGGAGGTSGAVGTAGSGGSAAAGTNWAAGCATVGLGRAGGGGGG